MKKITLLLLSFIMLLGATACAAPAAETAPSETPAPIVSETATPSPTAEPTPTPEPTMSPEEIEQSENMAEYEKYKMYYKTYGDDFALLFIKDMVDEGKITADMLDNINGTLGTFTDEETWNSYFAVYREYVAILYGEMEEMYPEGFNAVDASLVESSDQGILRVTWLETDEERERLIDAVDAINQWHENPTDENRVKMEDAYFSDDLTLAEDEILFNWMLSRLIDVREVCVENEMFALNNYINLEINRYDTSIGQKHYESIQKIIEMNNTPNSEKEWLTESEDD